MKKGRPRRTAPMYIDLTSDQAVSASIAFVLPREISI